MSKWYAEVARVIRCRNCMAKHAPVPGMEPESCPTCGYAGNPVFEEHKRQILAGSERRKDFEAWIIALGWDTDSVKRNGNGEYVEPVRTLWEAYKQGWEGGKK